MPKESSHFTGVMHSYMNKLRLVDLTFEKQTLSKCHLFGPYFRFTHTHTKYFYLLCVPSSEHSLFYPILPPFGNIVQHFKQSRAQGKKSLYNMTFDRRWVLEQKRLHSACWNSVPVWNYWYTKNTEDIRRGNWKLLRNMLRKYHFTFIPHLLYI